MNLFDIYFMDIITNKIQLAITDDEANILLSALSRFRGIYHENQDISHPDDKRRQERSIEIAESMRDTLETTLLDRYHNSLSNNQITNPSPERTHDNEQP